MNTSLFYSYFKPHRQWWIFSPLFVATEVCAELAQPFIMSRIIDDGLIGGKTGIVIPMGGMMLLITLVGMIGGVLSILAAGNVAYDVGADLRRDLYKKITSFSFLTLEKKPTYLLVTNMTTNVSRIQNVIQSSMRLLFRAPILLIGSIVMTFTVSHRLSYILFLVVPTLMLVILFITRRSYPLFMRVQERMENLNRVVQEFLNGIKVVKSYTQEKREWQRFEKANQSLSDASRDVVGRVVCIGPITTLTLNMGVALIVYGASMLMMENGEVQVGEVMAIVSYLAQILIAMLMAQHIVVAIAEAQTSWMRIEQVLEEKGKENTCDLPNEENFSEKSEANDSPLLTFDHVSFSYNENVPLSCVCDDSLVLRDVSFSIRNGETLGIIGGTGSGKSTVVQLLASNYTPTCGQIRLLGRPLCSYTKQKLQSMLVCVMQRTHLFSGSIAENLRYGKHDASYAEMKRACELAQILDFVESQKDGFSSLLTQGGGNLSGGQKQRLAVARSLLSIDLLDEKTCRNAILVMDDCLNGIDARTYSLLFEAVKSLSCSKIIVSQRIASVQKADKIIVLEKGRVVGYDTHERLLKDNSIYNEIYRSQRFDDVQHSASTYSWKGEGK